MAELLAAASARETAAGTLAQPQRRTIAGAASSTRRSIRQQQRTQLPGVTRSLEPVRLVPDVIRGAGGGLARFLYRGRRRVRNPRGPSLCGPPPAPPDRGPG